MAGSLSNHQASTVWGEAHSCIWTQGEPLDNPAFSPPAIASLPDHRRRRVLPAMVAPDQRRTRPGSPDGAFPACGLPPSTRP